MNPLVSVMIVTLFIMIAMGIVLVSGKPLIAKAEAATSLREAEGIMAQLNNYIRQISSEGAGSSRKITINSKDGSFEVSSSQDSIIYKLEGPPFYDYLSRKNVGDIYFIGGGDVDCYESGNHLIMENSRINASFQLIGSPDYWDSIDTSSNIEMLRQKDAGLTVYIVNSSVLVNDIAQTGYGNGYSEILKTGTKLPFCVVHFHVNSSYGKPYDIYYTLFNGADFIVQEVRGNLASFPISTNLAFHISNEDSIRVNDTTISSTSPIEQTYIPSKKFISSNSSGVVMGMVSAGTYLYNITLNTSYPGDDYLMIMREDYEDNRILMPFTSGNWQTIEDRLYEVRYDRIVGTTFGNFEVSSPDEIWLFVAMIFRDINITQSERFGTGTYDIVIRNLGKLNNLTRIEISSR